MPVVTNPTSRYPEYRSASGSTRNTAPTIWSGRCVNALIQAGYWLWLVTFCVVPAVMAW